MPYCALAATPNDGCSELDDMRFHAPRNSLNTAPPNTFDQPPTALWPRLYVSLEKSPDAIGSSSTGGSCRVTSMKL